MGKNSTSIKPGEVRNPHGRPKSEKTQKMEKDSDRFYELTESNFDGCVKKLCDLALAGDKAAISDILDRRMGRSFVRKEPEPSDQSIPIFVDKFASALVATSIPRDIILKILDIIESLKDMPDQEEHYVYEYDVSK